MDHMDLALPLVEVRRMVSGYTQVSKGNRPPVGVFPAGTFINDFIYTADGDLDEFNGRFCKTPEFPDGVYAYFCTIQGPLIVVHHLL